MHRDVERLAAGQVLIRRRIDEDQVHVRIDPPALPDNPLHTAHRFLPVVSVIYAELNEQQVRAARMEHMLRQPVRPERRIGAADTGIDAAQLAAFIHRLQVHAGQRPPAGRFRL
ncbi:hypothetical protein D3C80_1494460 [compost metagenome]